MYLRNQNELELRRFLVVSSGKHQKTHHYFIDSSAGPFPAITIEECVIVIIIRRHPYKTRLPREGLKSDFKPFEPYSEINPYDHINII